MGTEKMYIFVNYCMENRMLIGYRGCVNRPTVLGTALLCVLTSLYMQNIRTESIQEGGRDTGIPSFLSNRWAQGTPIRDPPFSKCIGSLKRFRILPRYIFRSQITAISGIPLFSLIDTTITIKRVSTNLVCQERDSYLVYIQALLRLDR